MLRILLNIIGLSFFLASCEPPLYALKVKEGYQNTFVKKEHEHAYMRYNKNKYLNLSYYYMLKNTSADTLLIDCEKLNAMGANSKKFRLDIAFRTHHLDDVLYNYSKGRNKNLILNPKDSVALTFLFSLDKVRQDEFNTILKDSIILSYADSRIEFGAKAIYKNPE